MQSVADVVAEILSLAERYQLGLARPEAEQLALYLDLLRAKNEQMNLTAIPPEEWVVGHVLDSLLPLPEIHEFQPEEVLDIGTGGGFPGIPLAVTLPRTQFLLIDGTGKKIRFVAESGEKIGLTNLSTRHARAEDLVKEGYQVGAIVTRAVAPLVKLLPLVAPLLKEGGVLFTYKGSRFEQEVAEASKERKRCHLALANMISKELPSGEARRIGVWRKVSAPPRTR